MTGQLLGQVILLIAGALAAVMLLQRLRMPHSLGYLAVGIVLGPHALDLAPEPDSARVIAELGIVFLLFTIGLNFSLPRIRAMGRSVFVLGTAQVALTTLLVGLGLWWGGFRWWLPWPSAPWWPSLPRPSSPGSLPSRARAMRATDAWARPCPSSRT